MDHDLDQQTPRHIGVAHAEEDVAFFHQHQRFEKVEFVKFRVHGVVAVFEEGRFLENRPNVFVFLRGQWSVVEAAALEEGHRGGGIFP